MANKFSWSVIIVSIILEIKIIGANLANQAVINRKQGASTSITLTVDDWARRNPHTLYRHYTLPQQIQHKYHFMLEPRRFSVQSRSTTGANQRIFNKRDEYPVKDIILKSNGKIWDLSANKKMDTREQSIKARLISKDGIQSREMQVNLVNNNSLTSKMENLNFPKRSLTRMLTSAKSLITGGMDQVTSRGNLILGSSLLAAAIPLAVLVLPESRSKKQRVDGQSDNSSISIFNVQSRVDSVMGWIERSVEHLPNFPRLHPQECVKRSICEAHNEPDKYGAVGFILRLFFPATNLSSTDRMDNMEYKVINKYRHAAGYGMNKRIDSNGTSSFACKEKYEDCLVSLLEVAQNLIDIFVQN